MKNPAKILGIFQGQGLLEVVSEWTHRKKNVYQSDVENTIMSPYLPMNECLYVCVIVQECARVPEGVVGEGSEAVGGGG